MFELPTVESAEIMNKNLRRYISHWAFLPVNQIEENTSLRSVRPDFGIVSKLAMLQDMDLPACLFGVGGLEGMVEKLDTLSDFETFLRERGCLNFAKPPKGY